MAPSVL